MARPLTSTEYLQLMAEHDLHIVLERGVGQRAIKRDVATLRSKDGRYMHAAHPAHSAMIEVPALTVTDYLDHGFVAPDGKNPDGHDIFRLTEDGKKIGLGRSNG